MSGTVGDTTFTKGSSAAYAAPQPSITAQLFVTNGVTPARIAAVPANQKVEGEVFHAFGGRQWRLFTYDFGGTSRVLHKTTVYLELVTGPKIDVGDYTITFRIGKDEEVGGNVVRRTAAIVDDDYDYLFQAPYDQGLSHAD